MAESSRSNYRWYIIALGALTHAFAVAMPQMCMPVLFKEISEDLNLTLVQLGAIWGIVALAAMFVIFIGGLLSDRLEVRYVLGIACFLIGVVGALRGLSGNFVTLSATMFLFGFVSAIIPLSVHKTCGIWFSGRRLGLANSIAAVGMALGSVVGSMISATILSPMLGGWRNVMFLYGGISIIIGILWLLTRSAPPDVESTADHATTVPFSQAISRVVRVRDVWLLGLIMMGQLGCVQGMTGYLPLYLREIGWTEAGADGTLAVFNGISMVVVIPMALLSDKLGSRRAFIFAATLITAIGVGILAAGGGATVWVAVIMTGIVRHGFMAVFMTMVMETEGIGVAYTGTALGLTGTLNRVGSFISPPLGNSLANANPSLAFIFWAGWAALAWIGVCFLKGKRIIQTILPVEIDSHE